MRIKKVSQTTATQAQVVDGYSTSTIDSYSCNYVNEITGKILWANSNPDDDFAAQTITLNSDDYDVLEWYYRSDSSGNLCFSEKSIKGYGTQFVMPSLSSGAKQWVRRIIRTSDTQFSVYDGRSLDSSTGTNANSFCVPLYVIGYKTGLFD